MRDERGHWYLLTGLLLGIVLGLTYAWLISPREYTDNSPASLRANFKDQYRAMIAAAYVANGNLPRARDRLDLLKDEDVARALAEQAQRSLAEGDSLSEAQALGLLSVALGQGAPTAFSPVTPNTILVTESPPSATLPAPATATGISLVMTPTVQTHEPSASSTTLSQTPAVTRTLLSTGTPLPTRTPTITPGSPFLLQNQTFVCDQDLSDPLIQVVTQDSTGQELSRVEVVVTWEGGEDHFFTGLKPELGQGYADFTMTPGVVYTLQLAGGGQVIPDLYPAECAAESGDRYWGSWLLVFARP